MIIALVDFVMLMTKIPTRSILKSKVVAHSLKSCIPSHQRRLHGVHVGRSVCNKKVELDKTRHRL